MSNVNTSSLHNVTGGQLAECLDTSLTAAEGEQLRIDALEHGYATVAQLKSISEEAFANMVEDAVQRAAA